MESKSYTIHGVKIDFPCQAYPTQLCMMDKIMRGLEGQKNCLLESPTGSGKSLALLCSCLAWQAAEYERIAKLEEEQNEKPGPNDCCEVTPTLSMDLPETTMGLTSSSSPEMHHPQMEEDGPSEITIEPAADDDDDTDDDFKPPLKRFRTPGPIQPVSKLSERKSQSSGKKEQMDCDPPKWNMELTRNDSSSSETSKEACSDDVKKSKGTQAQEKVPKIFYGTRTHKQVSQMTRELSKTAYKHARMCILSSREHSCIHPRVSQNKNKNDECKKLRDNSEGESCRYYHKESAIGSQSQIKHFGLVQAWDIEDLTRLGKKLKACPYYGARGLMKDADIIFCPYNYLIDPKIRKQMEIDLKDQIVILDEAHNVEDSARDSASLTLSMTELQETLDDLDKLVSMGIMPDHHRPLHIMVASIMNWVHHNEDNMTGREFERACKILSGNEIIKELEGIQLTAATIQLYQGHFQTASDPQRTQEFNLSMTSHTITVLEGLFLMFQYLFSNGQKYVGDYRVTILKTAETVRDNNLPGGWRRSGASFRKEWTYSLNFWCFNPAVVFSEVGATTRSIILTSGTLSPMGSFASELGVDFPIKLEANHVIADSQVWVGTLSVGPTGSIVNATYKHTETFSFQDEIGRIIHSVCQNVPHGVLVFFPSYSMMEKLCKRWQSTGLWRQLLQLKVVVKEPRSGGKSEFDSTMHEFYKAIRLSEGSEEVEQDSDDSDSEESGNGALFLAVCRGKVSEGLDFADNNARAVITVGIPFPNTKDIQVDLKRKFNNQHARTRGLLNGSEWYEIQAFRALNQALGRCIRHKKDWGAILLVDERFSKSERYSNSISKWVRRRIKHYNHFPSALDSLKTFTEARKLDPFPDKSPLSLKQPSTPASSGLHMVDNTSMPSTLTPLKPEQQTPSARAISPIGLAIKSEGSPFVGTEAQSRQQTSTPLTSNITSKLQGNIPPVNQASMHEGTVQHKYCINQIQSPLAVNPGQLVVPRAEGMVQQITQVVQREPAGATIRLLVPSSMIQNGQTIILPQVGNQGRPVMLTPQHVGGPYVQVLPGNKAGTSGSLQVAHTILNNGQKIPLLANQVKPGVIPLVNQTGPSVETSNNLQGVKEEQVVGTTNQMGTRAQCHVAAPASTAVITNPLQQVGTEPAVYMQKGTAAQSRNSLVGSTNTASRSASITGSQSTVDRSASTARSHITVDRSASTDGSHITVDRSASTDGSHITVDRSASTAGSHITVDRSASTAGSHITVDRSASTAASHITVDRSASTAGSHITVDRSASMAGSYSTAGRSESHLTQQSTPLFEATRYVPRHEAEDPEDIEMQDAPCPSSPSLFSEPTSPLCDDDTEVGVKKENQKTVVKRNKTFGGSTTRSIFRKTTPTPSEHENQTEKSEVAKNLHQGETNSVMKPNLRRATRNTRTAAKRRALDATEEGDVSEAGESTLYCSYCGSLLLKGKIDKQTINQKEITSLCAERAPAWKKRNGSRKRRRDSGGHREMYIVSDADQITLRALLPGQELNNKCSGMNAVYLAGAGMLYVPQLCKSCPESSGHPVGLEAISVHHNSENVPPSRQIWLFCESVQLTMND